MNYRSAVNYLESFINYGINPGLERIKRLAKRLGDPQYSYPAVHITGTNGKTSTAIIISSILSSLGMKIGLYTSPHLERVNERIAIGNNQISDEVFASLLSRIKPEIEKVNNAGNESLTYFEVLTALAFLYFKEEQVDCAVFEVGMGGCWDATNLVHSKVAVITNIEYDHTDLLGDSLTAIAGEKLGIIKQKSCVITAEKKTEIVRMMEERCSEQCAVLKILGRDFEILSYDKNVARVKGIYETYDNLPHTLLGYHQITNLAIAIAGCEGFTQEALPKETLCEALKHVSNPGRLEVIYQKPLVVLDGAHNPHGATALVSALRQFKFNRLILVLSILKDKDVDSILKIILPYSDYTIVAQNKNSRALESRELAKKVEKFTSEFYEVKGIASAIKKAMARASESDLVLITGSLYTVGEARAFLKKQALSSKLGD